jgi:2-iminobutanoate/2-iminopropanoate deaminase
MPPQAVEPIQTEHAPAAIGPYSQAIKANGMLFTAGQIPLDPTTTMKPVGGGIREQAEQVMKNLAAVLEAGGSGLDRVIKTTCFLTDLGDFATFNEVYARAFGDHAPARSTVQVAALPAGVLIEVECIALLTR